MSKHAHKYPSHQYPESFKKACVKSYLEKADTRPVLFVYGQNTTYDPSRRTIRRWRHLYPLMLATKPRTGPQYKKKLTEKQRRVSVGSVVAGRRTGERVYVGSLQKFIREAWGVDVSMNYVSLLMKEYHMSSQRVAFKKSGFFKEGNATEALKFVKGVRAKIHDMELEDKDVVCADVFHIPGRVYSVRTYAPVGGYVRYRLFCNRLVVLLE